MSRTVKLNPLWVILSVVAGAQLAGLVGALLAIPAAGAIQVILREVWEDWRAAHPQPSEAGPPLPATDDDDLG
jgi:predicted PurR-regulated permease PerM